METKPGYPSGQRGQTVNLLAQAYVGSNPSPGTSIMSRSELSLSYRETAYPAEALKQHLLEVYPQAVQIIYGSMDGRAGKMGFSAWQLEILSKNIERAKFPIRFHFGPKEAPQLVTFHTIDQLGSFFTIRLAEYLEQLDEVRLQQTTAAQQEYQRIAEEKAAQKAFLRSPEERRKRERERKRRQRARKLPLQN